jgi:selenide,water dikinase
MTDVTGFGLFGHALEVARASNVSLNIRFDDLPFLNEAGHLAQRNFVTGASTRNWASYAESINLPAGFPEWQRHLLTDPQTSGGLLVACDQSHAAAVTQMIVEKGYPHARIV